MNPHASRIQTASSEIHRRGRLERLEPPAILIETRRLLESERLDRAFPKVKLYADWCAHALLDRDGAASVLLEITAALNGSVRNSSNPSIDALYGSVCSALAISDLQKELVSLYKQYGIDGWCVSDARMFRQFMGAILDSIAELPLCFPLDIATRKGKLRKIYDEACRLANRDQHWIVTECLVTNKLSKEQLAFYGVPEGTYLWQIQTAAGVAWCGTL